MNALVRDNWKVGVVLVTVVGILLLNTVIKETTPKAMQVPPTEVSQQSIEVRKAERRAAARADIASGKMVPLKPAEAMPTTKASSTPSQIFIGPQELVQLQCPSGYGQVMVYKIVDGDNTLYVALKMAEAPVIAVTKK